MSNKPGYKPTPLGWIPEEWEIKKFGEIVSSSQYGLSNASSDGGRYKIIGMKNIQRGELVTDECATVNLKEDEFEKYKLLPGDFLFNRTNSYDLVGKSVLIEFDPDATFASYLIRFKLNKRKVVPKFVYYFFNTDKSDKKLKAIATKAVSQANINPTVLQRIFEVLIPPLHEQQKIAAILSTWDEAIAKNQQLIAQLQQRNKGLMQQLLTGKKRLKGFCKEWREVRFGDITVNFSRRNKSLVNAKIYSVTNTNGFVLQSEHFSREVAGEDLSNYKIIQKNEFAYNPARINVGSIAYFTEDIGVISSLYVCFSTTDKILDYYLELLLKLDLTKHKISSYGEGGVRIYLWYDLFKTIRIKIPERKEQEVIVQILKKSNDEISLYQQKLFALQHQKKGLMQKLLTGEVRVKINN